MNKKSNNLFSLKSVIKALFFCFVLGSSTVFAEVKLTKLFSDHVVLQRQKQIPVWGWANPNESVSVAFNGQNKLVNSNSSGKRTVIFAPTDANLFNSAGFPASPFRTDDWQGVTVGNKFQ